MSDNMLLNQIAESTAGSAVQEVVGRADPGSTLSKIAKTSSTLATACGVSAQLLSGNVVGAANILVGESVGKVIVEVVDEIIKWAP